MYDKVKDHDCHLSPMDGCAVCEDVWNDKVCIWALCTEEATHLIQDLPVCDEHYKDVEAAEEDAAVKLARWSAEAKLKVVSQV